MLRKLGSYPRQNGLAVALRELGRIERTLFILDWLQSVELRRRVHTGLNKGEARNALARAVFFYRLGEIRDRSFEQQQYRASGLTLATDALHTALQNLHHCLLNQSIQHRWDAKFPHPSVRLRDFHPTYRLRLIGPTQQLFPDV